MCMTKASPYRIVAIALCLLCCAVKVAPVVAIGFAALSSGASFDFRLPLIITGWTCIGLASFMMLRTSRELSASMARDKTRKTQD